MKIKSFLLIILFFIISKIQISFADETKMIKGLEIFNETREVRKLIVEARQDIPEDNKAKMYFKYSRNNSFPDGQ